MYPELFTIGSFTIYTYGLLVAIGFFVGMQYIIKYSSNIPMKKQQVYDFLFYLILVGILGARLLYVLTNIDFFIKHPFDIVKVWQGGLVFYGGFLAVLIFAFFYCRNKKIDIKKLADVSAPALALGHSLGRIGCFFSGCCYGRECDFLLSVNHKHPTQLYESFGNLMIFFMLHHISKKEHKKGLIFVSYLCMYSVLRFFVEFFRGDDRGAFIIGLSIAQVISLLIFIISFVWVSINYGVKNEK
ncbi:MAG: prolipoprotein diacylglyceryl transferase [Endomicrobiaceae bacterium]|nr:prolipoprotein diacylglyceryl transferase [Endomicrobiaceae bacterium]